MTGYGRCRVREDGRKDLRRLGEAGIDRFEAVSSIGVLGPKDFFFSGGRGKWRQHQHLSRSDENLVSGRDLLNSTEFSEAVRGW